MTPFGLRAGEDARFEEMLYAGHGQLHPTYARVSAEDVEQPVDSKVPPDESVSGLTVADYLAAALAHRLDGVSGRRPGYPRESALPNGLVEAPLTPRARLSQAEVSPATADLIR